jgi:hypothetical protein
MTRSLDVGPANHMARTHAGEHRAKLYTSFESRSVRHVANVDLLVHVITLSPFILD